MEAFLVDIAHENFILVMDYRKFYFELFI